MYILIKNGIKMNNHPLLGMYTIVQEMYSLLQVTSKKYHFPGFQFAN